MKSICLMTSEESFMTNYGAALQGYALYNILSEFGYEVNIQRYLGGDVNNVNQNKHSFLNILKKYTISEIFLKLLFRVGKITHKNKVKSQGVLFKDFQDTYLSFYPGDRKNWSTLKIDPPQADIYLCGSDQIWNPTFKNGYNDPGYFLAFALKNKIAYAPSFGISDIPETSQRDLKDLLIEFDYVSVREKMGADIIKKYTGIDAKIVLDPTLLLDENDWRSISKLPNKIPEKYILCYRFGNSLEVDRQIKHIAKNMKLPIIELPLSGISYLNFFRDRLFEAGPREFIGLIDNASLVCTDSFHATVFSIIMETPFVTFLRSNDVKKGEGMNSRVINLLETLGLNDRLSNNILLENPDTILNISFKEPKQKLIKEKEQSKEWLREALSGMEGI